MTFAVLSRQAQVARLRALGRAALAAYGLQGAPFRLLQHEYNTTFRVGGRYVLRVGRAHGQTLAALASEAAWLHALAEETDLVVPAPVPTRDGALAVMASAPGVPEERACVLLRWVEGRFRDASLRPVHARRIARVQAALHEHALGWTPPPGFTRPPASRLTARAADGPAADEAEALRLVAALMGPRDAQTVRDALARVRDTERALAAEPGGVALVHGDLHHENVVFAGTEARAIDFDDCGVGPLLYDLAVTRFELTTRPALRDALLDEYAGLRGLPPRAEEHLAALELLRRVQMVMWVLESREHPRFRAGWRAWAREDLDALAAAVS
ncbi:MAG: phosphotransferase [Solirubrobacteraceae bacterium]